MRSSDRGERDRPACQGERKQVLRQRLRRAWQDRCPALLKGPLHQEKSLGVYELPWTIPDSTTKMHFTDDEKNPLANRKGAWPHNLNLSSRFRPGIADVNHQQGNLVQDGVPGNDGAKYRAGPTTPDDHFGHKRVAAFQRAEIPPVRRDKPAGRTGRKSLTPRPGRPQRCLKVLRQGSGRRSHDAAISWQNPDVTLAGNSGKSVARVARPDTDAGAVLVMVN